MKKVLYGLLGATLLALPLWAIGQNPEKKSYEYNIYLGDIDIGDATCSGEKVSFNIDFLFKQDLTFEKRGNKYFESFKEGKEEEKYFYSKSDSLRLDKYFCYRKDKEKESLKREDKIRQVGKGYSLETLFGTEVFSVFGGDSIPKKLQTQIFGDIYFFEFDEKFGVKKLWGDITRVRYKVPVNPQTNSDKFRINEPIEIDLKMENGNYHIFGARINGDLKTWFSWISLNVGVLEKGD